MAWFWTSPRHGVHLLSKSVLTWTTAPALGCRTQDPWTFRVIGSPLYLVGYKEDGNFTGLRRALGKKFVSRQVATAACVLCPVSSRLQPCPGSHHGYITLSVIVGFVPNPFPQADLTSRCRLPPRSSPALVHYLSYVLTLRHKTRLAETGKERRKVIIS
ncbi:hypothetical protein EJ05DRAFT_61170 [Pseudovirgaria hyperparasitica]|uniref:Uncharacterized protein n=1 Tax=Pseudovirgaria hyperparasitica TaxID=470096 RepID=A0A6A6VSX1_9PEZI|nr:uncharacterized protein EJ05DRAFT_61170 [Pseudovirgaria hyperparasitica]KAF2752371.1 hypothetical protein EJ05DRAFT_61170 [Pseudovirgaria hyperparasitica]